MEKTFTDGLSHYSEESGRDKDGNLNGYDPLVAGDLQVTGGAATNVFFSEYIEGSSYNKAVEIYNVYWEKLKTGQ